MNLKRILRDFVVAVALVGVTSMASSCSKDDPGDGSSLGKGSIAGIITGDEGTPLADVKVSLSGVSDGGIVGGVISELTTTADGVYSFSDVSVGSYVVTFVKARHQTINMTVTAALFKEEGVNADIKMIIADASISGTVRDADQKLLEGVTVSVGAGLSASTDANGEYTIKDLAVGDYTITFSKTDFAIGSKTISKSQFIDSKATGIDFVLGAPELLRGKTINELLEAGKWYYNEYRGGRNGTAGRWNWSYDFMCTLDFEGRWEEQNEGTTLRIRQDDGNDKNPANLTAFDSYTYGSKTITADNKILTLLVRTHGASDASPSKFGVQIIDLSAAKPVTTLIDGVKSVNQGNDDCKSFDFDLTPYIGKKVIVAVGIFRAATGSGYDNQLVLRRIAFAQEKVNGFDIIPGTPVVGLEGWRITQEMVRSTMVNTNKKFTGISPIGGSEGNYRDGYVSWRGINHFGVEWAFVTINKDTEPFAGEGFVIKTNGGGTPVNIKLPASYFYAKFAIAEGNNKFTFNTRNFGSNSTFFKVTAIEDDGTVTHLSPASNTAESASAADEGCWKFKHGRGDKNNPAAYASFVYDLSSYNGKSVVIAIGVFKGEANGDESKLVFHSMSIN